MTSIDRTKDDNEKYSLSSKVFKHLREDILSGKYHDQDELKEAAIASEYGVSRTPVREALRQLELEGLVSMIPNRGAYVNGIDNKDVRDIFAIRGLLEGLCARWATENITDEQLDGLEEIVMTSEFYLQKGRLDQVYENDNKFHDALYAAADSPILEHVLKSFHEYVQQARKQSLTYETRALTSVEEHAAIVDAIKEKDPEKAAMLAEKHIKKAETNIESSTKNKI